MSDKLTKKYQKLFEQHDGLKCRDVMACNYNPHPFMLGPKHISFAADNYRSILGDACMNDSRFPTCADRGCGLSPDQHTHDLVCFLQLERDIESVEISGILLKVKDEAVADDVDGFAFIENEFQIISASEKQTNASQLPEREEE
jgi:hypothetical protein